MYGLFLVAFLYGRIELKRIDEEKLNQDGFFYESAHIDWFFIFAFSFNFAKLLENIRGILFAFHIYVKRICISPYFSSTFDALMTINANEFLLP